MKNERSIKFDNVRFKALTIMAEKRNITTADLLRRIVDTWCSYGFFEMPNTLGIDPDYKVVKFGLEEERSKQLEIDAKALNRSLSEMVKMIVDNYLVEQIQQQKERLSQFFNEQNKELYGIDNDL